MTNNDILRRLRYAFDISDSKMIALFALAELKVSREQISDWLKKDDDPAYKACSDIEMATFLNGFINDKRGKKDGPQPEPEKRLTNNIILRKLRIALNLQDEGMLEILKLVDYRLSKHELSAFFRKPDHRQYRECKDQVLRNFLHGLQVKYRPDGAAAKATAATAGKSTVTAEKAAATPAKHVANKTVAKKTPASPVKDSKQAFQWQSGDKPETAAKKTSDTTTKGSKPAFQWPEK